MDTSENILIFVLSPYQMDPATRVQNLIEAVCISHDDNILVKAMDPTTLLLVITLI